MAKKKYPKRIINKAFTLWVENNHNCTAVRRGLEEAKLEPLPTLMTITRWSDRFDWEAQEAVSRNQLKRLMKSSTDPILRSLAMDDLEFAKALAQVYRVIRQVLKDPKRHGIIPKSMKEVVEVIKFLRESQKELLGLEEKAANPSSITINDNRKVEFKTALNNLEPGQRRMIIDQARGILEQGSKEFQEARQQVLTNAD